MTRYGIKDNQVRAFNKMIRISHQKLNLVCDMVRGLPVDRAVDVLKFSKKRVSDEVLKTLLSAVANAEHNKNLPVDTLFIKEIWCGKALTMKRIMYFLLVINRLPTLVRVICISPRKIADCSLAFVVKHHAEEVITVIQRFHIFFPAALFEIFLNGQLNRCVDFSVL